MNKLTNYEKGYLEGLIDGEGCISLTQRNSGYSVVRPEVVISNTNLKLINKVKKITGGNISTMYHKNPKHKTCYSLKFTSKIMKEILPQLRLVIKEHKRKTILKILVILKKRQHGIGRWYPDYSRKKLLKLVKSFYKNG